MNLTFDEIGKIIELSIAVIGLLLVVFGWFIPYKQSVRTTNRQNQGCFYRRQLWILRTDVDFYKNFIYPYCIDI